MNTQLPCPFCSSKKGYVYTQSHYQCLECKRVVDDCCNGEVMNCHPEKHLEEDVLLNFNKNFENENLFLCQAKNEDFDELFSIASDKKIWEQHPENDRWKRDKFSSFFENGIANEFGMLKIYDKILNKIIGSTRFYSLDKIDNSIKIGFTFIVREYWGTTINYQVKDMMINYTFQFLDKIYFDIGVHNHRSRKAIEKIGAILFKDNVTGNVIYKLRKKDYVNNEIKK